MKTLNPAAFGAFMSKLTARFNYRMETNFSFTADECTDLGILLLEAVNVPEAEAPRADASLIAGMLNAIKLNRKIDAIKCHRMLTGYGLKESKDVIEAHWSDNSVEMRLRGFVSKLANDNTGASSLDDWRDSACAVLKEIEAR